MLGEVRLSTMLVDSLSARLLWLTIGGIMISIISSKTISLLWCALLGAVTGVFITENILIFYLLFELRLVPILLIIIFSGRQPERLSAGAYFLFYTTAVSVPYLAIVLQLFPHFSFLLRKAFLSRRLMSLLLSLPFLVKIPVLGFHYWLPKAHVEARTSGSIVLAGLLLKLGSYGLARLYFLLYNFACYWVNLWVLMAFLARIITMVQSDIKKYIAYSRVTHITFILLGLLSSNKLVFLRTVLMSLAHGWASIGIFFSGGALRHPIHSRLGAFSMRERALHWALLLTGLLLVSNASIPPMPSFFPELSIVVILRAGSFSIVWLFVLLRLGVCYYNAYLFLWAGQIKAATAICITFRLRYSFVLKYLVITSFISLGWLIVL